MSRPCHRRPRRRYVHQSPARVYVVMWALVLLLPSVPRFWRPNRTDAALARRLRKQTCWDRFSPNWRQAARVEVDGVETVIERLEEEARLD